jgi:multiple sugar transport system substrate-binding protein
MKKSIVIILAALMVCSSLLMGCTAAKTDATAANAATAAATEAAAETAAPAEKAEPVEIHYAYWASPMDDFYAKCKAEFEAANPNVTIVLEPTAWSEYWTKLETAATGGSVADVFHMNGVNIKKYADGGVLLPLDSYIASSALDMSKFPQAMNDMYNFNGAQYGIPMDYDTVGLWYNKTLFDQAKIAYPTDSWTWADLTKAAAAITALGDGNYGIAAGFQDQQGIYNTVFAEGGWFVKGSESGDTFGFNEAGTRAGIQCWVDLMKAGYSPSEASLEENEGYLQFMAGKIGMIFSGDWMVSYYNGADSSVAGKCDVAKLPLMENGQRASVIHGKANCVSAATQHPDEAWAWVNYLAGAEANKRLGEMGIAIPANTDYSSLFFGAYPEYNMGIYSDAALNYSFSYPSSLTRADWADIVRTELQKAFKLEITVDEACDNIMSQLG